jgi:diaminopimelate epimerase
MLRFVKYHGAGNDFILVDGLSAQAAIRPAQAIQLCDRHFGIGADGVILALPSKIADCRMQLYNSDGSEAEMCGNGLRCLVRFAWDEGLIRKTELTVETLAGLRRARLAVHGPRVIEISVEMGSPLLLASDVPTTLAAPTASAVEAPLVMDDTLWHVTALNTGVPHCVIFVEDAEATNWRTIGPRIAAHPAFPQKTNVMFTQLVAQDHLYVRPWERGAGPTLACGTGACAAAIAAVLTGRAGRDVQVTLPGGTLRIQWDAGSNQIIMTGPAERVFVGELTEHLLEGA